MGMVPAPLPSTSTGRGLHSGSVGFHPLIPQDLSQSPQKFLAKYKTMQLGLHLLRARLWTSSWPPPRWPQWLQGRRQRPMTTVLLASLSLSPVGGFVHVMLPEAVWSASDTVDTHPGFSEISQCRCLISVLWTRTKLTSRTWTHLSHRDPHLRMRSKSPAPTSPDGHLRNVCIFVNFEIWNFFLDFFGSEFFCTFCIYLFIFVQL